MATPFTIEGDLGPSGRERETLPGPARCTHGPDPAPSGVDVGVSRLPRPAPAYLPTFRQIAARVDDVFVRSAAETGGSRHVRYVNDASCAVSVANVVLSPTGDDTIHTTMDELTALGFDRADRKYLVWVDATVYCGIAEIYNDDRRSEENFNNGNTRVPGMFARVDSGCWRSAVVRTTRSPSRPTGRSWRGATTATASWVTAPRPGAPHRLPFRASRTSPRWPPGSTTASRSSPTGTVWAWGWNVAGQVGDGTTVDRRSPVAVAGLTGVTSVAAGSLHNLARRADGTVWSWGWNTLGQLGDGTTTDRRLASPVPGLSGITGVAAGVYHSLALRGGDGSVRAWGWNHFGQLGDNNVADRLSPVTVAGLTGMTSVVAGYHHSLAVSGSGAVVAWGWNAHGQLGDGSTVDRRGAVPVAGPLSALKLGGAAFHTLAV